MIKPNVAQLSLYTYNPKLLRYQNIETGHIVSAKEVRDAADTVIDSQALRMQNASQALVDGKINLAAWQLEMSSLLKDLHVAMGLAASGGLNATSASDMGYIASQIKEQYKYLRNFALQIKRGEQKLDVSLVVRAGSYAQAARGTYERVQQRKAFAAGLTMEKSVLDGAAKHCSPCVDEAGKGWVSIGSLIPIGQRQCRGNCRCHFIYRQPSKAEQALVPDQLTFEQMMGQLGTPRGGAAIAEAPILPTRVPGQAVSISDLRVKYPQTKFEFDEVDPALHARIVSHLDQLFTEFPNVARSLNYVGSGRFTAEFGEQYARSAAIATHWSGKSLERSEIHLNPARWGDAADFQERLNKALEIGYIPPGGNKPEAILTHEFGHVVNYHINRTSEAANIFQTQNESLGSLVSGYAATDPRKEAWAEAFSSARHTPPDQWAEYTKRLAQFLRIGKRE